MNVFYGMTDVSIHILIASQFYNNSLHGFVSLPVHKLKIAICVHMYLGTCYDFEGAIFACLF